MKKINDFSADEKAVIRKSRKTAGNVLLGRVFGCDPRTIAAIGRETAEAVS